ncbi:Glycosyl transferase, family 39 [Nostoc sp. NIES-3756]|uniref:dolichyl-phosphate-mannose--protein mannosyltransferase n=1 Tax=Nostoc sp. NIES-3756 TaxID=1751286 RepID=UPI00071F59AB|nr:phospholipid carrier-dependent glycosyltransferase [Nostoc sp. NIES-3756]BAT53037.1 Glycosyl transferase, family 39 [Nostoc sp. NIES-3756]
MTKNLYRIGLLSIFLLSLSLRFWGLDRFNTLVFDEIYYAKFGHNYLNHLPFFDGHPPFGKYMIALGMWLSSYIPFWQEGVNGLTGAMRSPWSYRWINALSGSFIPIFTANIAYQISNRPGFALLAGLFTALDGLFLVESRYALINIYIVIFGLLGQWLFLLALSNYRKKRNLYLILAGVAFGCSIATKWNGLFYLVGIYLIWGLGWVWQLITGKNHLTDEQETNTQNISSLYKLTQVNIWQIILFLGIIPTAIYSLIWVPHLQINPKYNFIQVHQEILGFHERLGGNTAQVHPYCAAWYKWPLMTRPMAYYYQTAQSVNDPLPVLGPPLPSGAGKVIYDVHAMGNPFLWWFGVAALLFLMGMLMAKVAIPLVKKQPLALPKQLSVDSWIAIYILLNYAVNLLPWTRVSRCAFIYHYMTAVVFAFLAIAWFVDQCLRSYHPPLRIVGVTISFLIIAAFIFWLPVYLGLPLSPEGYKLRMWFRSWV